MGWAAAAAAAVQLISSEQAKRERANATDKSNSTLQNYYNMVNGISIPDKDKMALALENYQSAGQMSPDTENSVQLGSHDALQDVNLDPRLKQAQMQQLETLQKLGDTGLTPDEKAQLNSMQHRADADAQSRMRSLLEQQQARGVGTGEAGLAARLIDSQSSANRQATDADQMASTAFNRALQAKAGAANLAGNMENADYGRQSNLANSRNAREMANVNLQAGTQQRNIDRFNQAQATNLNANQNLMNSNVNLRNTQQQYNKQLTQQEYENQLRKMGLLSGPTNTMANNFNNQGNANADATAGMGQGIGKSIMGAGSYGGK